MEYLQYIVKTTLFLVTFLVLNLVINGIPSILNQKICMKNICRSFKPCYKWNTFNTLLGKALGEDFEKVLNLVINGIPSIQYEKE